MGTARSARHPIRRAAPLGTRRTGEREIARVTAWWQANAERANEAQRWRRAEDPQRDREGHLTRTFGISLTDYDRMLDEQGGGCAICGDLPQDGRSFHAEHLDDLVRTIVCARCNNALGQLKEDAELACRATDCLSTGCFSPCGVDELRGLARSRASGLRAA